MTSLLTDLVTLYTEHPTTMGVFTMIVALIATSVALIDTRVFRLLFYPAIVLAVAAIWYFICRYLGIIEGLS